MSTVVELNKKLTFHNLTAAHMQPMLKSLLKNHTLGQLKKKCKTCGLTASGSKSELAIRFREYQESSMARQFDHPCASISTSTPDSADASSALFLLRTYDLTRSASAPNILMTKNIAQQPVAKPKEPVFSRDFVITPEYTSQSNKRKRDFGTPDLTIPIDKNHQRLKHEPSSASGSAQNSGLTDQLLSSMLEKARKIFSLEGMQPPHPVCPVG